MPTRLHESDLGVVLTHTTTRPEGDFAVGGEPEALHARRRGVVDLPWIWLHQVHGADVVVATADNAAEVVGSEADAIVTRDAGLVLAIHTADCLPVAFSSPEGVIGAAHAGWRGLEAGIIERTVDAMRSLGATEIRFRAGPPSIGPECYEFGEADLDRLAARFGDEIRGSTTGGAPALDLRRALSATLERAGLDRGEVTVECTSCAPDRWFSHRARGEKERMATLIWRDHANGRVRASP